MSAEQRRAGTPGPLEDAQDPMKAADLDLDGLDGLMGDLDADGGILPEVASLDHAETAPQPDLASMGASTTTISSGIAGPSKITIPDEQRQTSGDIESDRQNMLVSYFDDDQIHRYQAFRRSNIRRGAVKKYASQLLNQPISNTVAVVLAGMSKVLIGDIIELARDLQEKDLASERAARGLPNPASDAEPEPLLPSYIREAWRIYKEETGTVPGPKVKAGSGGRFF